MLVSIGPGDVSADSVTITLRAAVRLSAEAGQVRLADVALLEGESAAALGEIVIGPAPRSGATAEFSVRDVRSALDEAGVHWGRTHLNGRSVVVRANHAGGASAPLPMASVSLDDAATQTTPSRERRAPAVHLAAALLSGDDLRCAIAGFLVENLNVHEDALRLAFDDGDAELLEAPLAAHRFEIEPMSSLRSARVELAIRRWDGGRIVERHTISVAPTVRAQVAVLNRDVERGAGVSASDFDLREQWLAPNAIESIISDPAIVSGRVTGARLRKGEVLRESHLQRETIVRRGELVVVRCIVGGAVISLQAEARAAAAVGETIEFRKPGDRDTFLATVTGRGAAVVDLSMRNQQVR